MPSFSSLPLGRIFHIFFFLFGQINENVQYFLLSIATNEAFDFAVFQKEKFWSFGLIVHVRVILQITFVG